MNTLNVHFTKTAHDALNRASSGIVGVKITFPAAPNKVWDGTLLFGDEKVEQLRVTALGGTLFPDREFLVCEYPSLCLERGFLVTIPLFATSTYQNTAKTIAYHVVDDATKACVVRAAKGQSSALKPSVHASTSTTTFGGGSDLGQSTSVVAANSSSALMDFVNTEEDPQLGWDMASAHNDYEDALNLLSFAKSAGSDVDESFHDYYLGKYAFPF